MNEPFRGYAIVRTRANRYTNAVKIATRLSRQFSTHMYIGPDPSGPVWTIWELLPRELTKGEEDALKRLRRRVVDLRNWPHHMTGTMVHGPRWTEIPEVLRLRQARPEAFAIYRDMVNALRDQRKDDAREAAMIMNDILEELGVPLSGRPGSYSRKSFLEKLLPASSYGP